MVHLHLIAEEKKGVNLQRNVEEKEGEEKAGTRYYLAAMLTEKYEIFLKINGYMYKSQLFSI